MTRAVNVSDIIDTRAVGAFQLRAFLLCAAVLFVDGFDVQGITYVVPTITREWGLVRGQLWPALTAGLVGVMLGAMLLAPLADRVGRRRVIVYSCVAFGALTLLTLAVDSLPSLVVLRFLTGLGLGSALPNAIGLASEYAPHKRRALVVMFVGSGISLGAIAAGIAATQLVTPFGWRAMFVVGGVLPLVLAVLLAARVAGVDSLRGADPEPPRRGEAAAPQDQARTRRRRRRRDRLARPEAGKATVLDLFGDGRGVATVCLWVAFFMSLLNVYLAINWLPTSLEASGIHGAQASGMTTLYHVGGVARHLRDRLADGSPRRVSHGVRRAAACAARVLYVRDRDRDAAVADDGDLGARRRRRHRRASRRQRRSRR